MQLEYGQAKRLLEGYKIKMPKGAIVKKENELERKLKGFKFPLVMKIDSRDVIHKSDVKGVRVGIQNLGEAKKAFVEILKNVRKKFPRAKINGVLCQELAKGKELIIGGKIDAQFGPIVLFGLGGVFVELLKDVSIRLAPITLKEAKEMTHEIKGYAYLKGFRGERSINFKAVESLLVKVGNLMSKEKGNVKELDLNPVIANDKNAELVDVRIIK